jgi:cellulose synthase (UDP-forming)
MTLAPERIELDAPLDVEPVSRRARLREGYTPRLDTRRMTLATPPLPPTTILPDALPSAPPGATAHLPQAPGDDELYLYYGAQHRWFIWLRSIATLSSAASLVLFSGGAIPLWLFWIPFTIFVGYTFLTHITTTRKRRVSRFKHEMQMIMWWPEQFPSVDVFLPCAGEDLAILENTYRHVAQLDYLGEKRVYVLDDSGRDAVRELADSFGFTYYARPDRGHMKKAGNLKYGFDHSAGDLIVIFDADFCPRPDFIRHLAPYFDVEDVAIVQSPQHFDTHRELGWLQRCAGTVQESFYRWAQPSRHELGAPICVGTCAIYRRSALDKSGGFAQIGHSEDVHTGVNLMKVGFRTIYVPVILAKGVCPDKLSSFVSQQYRWCAGSMSLLRDRSFHNSPLRYRQRMCFFTGFGYYISTAVGVFMLPLPTIIMLWFLPDRVRLSNFFWLIPTFLMYPLIRMIHKTGWTPDTLRVYTISSFSHAAAIWHTLIGRTAEWVPSGETRKTSMTSRVTALMVTWTALTNSLMIGGCVRFLLQGRSPVDVGPVFVVSLLASYTWLPIAWLAWQERRARIHAVAVAVAV